MIYRKTAGDYIFDFFNGLILTVLTLSTLYPFIYIAFASISLPADLASHTGILLKPLGFSLSAYKAVIKNPMVITGYRNTLFYVVAGTALNIFMTSLAAFVLSRKKFFWTNFITMMVVITMFFRGGLIPEYLLVHSLKLYNSVWAIILPVAINTWNLFIMRTFFRSIPDSLEESAKIDGAIDFTVFLKIILPLSLPVIAVMILYYGVSHWNSWFSAMIYLRSRNLYPLQLFLREILIANETDDMLIGIMGGERESISETIKYATIMVSTLPVLFAYPFLQRYFVKGVMIGAIKG